jgi:hypothetical protein
MAGGQAPYERRQRRPYAWPRLVSGAPVERLALACTGVSFGGPTVPKRGEGSPPDPPGRCQSHVQAS